MSATSPSMHERWQAPGAGLRYREARFASARARERDPRLVRAILGRASLPSGSAVLDVPCGSGRLRPVLEDAGLAYFGTDVSPTMLRAALGERVVRADARRLPFPDASFDLVVCCRLLHHVEREEELAALLAELLRVSRCWLAASFWDAGSLAAWRERTGLRRARAHPEGRIARPRRSIRALVERAGAELVSFHHSLRFVSQQTFFLARRTVTAVEDPRACPS